MKNKKFYKISLGVIVVVILLLLGTWAINRWGASFFGTSGKVSEQDEKYWKNLEEAYKKDEYGGKTPEETLTLFVEALKNQDANLASKYFVPQKQEEYEKTIENWINKNQITNIVKILSKTRKSEQTLDNMAQVPVVEGDRAVMVIDFALNKFSNKWKIESL